MQHLKQIPLTVLILTAGQLVFAVAIIAITSHGLATLDYTPYESAFFAPLAERLEAGTLAGPEKSTVVEIVRSFPAEVNRAFQLSRHADKTALAVALCMLALPVAIVIRTTRRTATDTDPRTTAADESLYLVIETFKEGKLREIYQRASSNGRMLPAGLKYIDSWVTQDLARCFQLMSCRDPQLLDEWQQRWADVVDFQIQPVLESSDAAARVLNRD